MKSPEEPVDQDQEQLTLIGCTWSGPGRLCRYAWSDGTVECFTQDMWSTRRAAAWRRGRNLGGSE